MLPHARPFVMWYQPLIAGCHEPAPAVLRYRREATATGWSVEDDARLCVALLAHLGIERSTWSGTPTAASSPLSSPVRVSGLRSLALLEPATVGLLPPDEAAAHGPRSSRSPGPRARRRRWTGSYALSAVPTGPRCSTR